MDYTPPEIHFKRALQKVEYPLKWPHIRPRRRKPQRREERTRINEQIRAPELRVVGPEGENFDVMKTEDAVKKAKDMNMDLIEISPKAKPPVAKIADYGKFQYEQAKKAKEAKAKAHTTETKSVQIEVVTGENDLTRKARQAASWLKEGHRVKIELFLKGRYKYMDPEFLKERLKRFTLLVPEEYKIAEDIKKAPKGYTIVLERVSGKAKKKEEKAQEKTGEQKEVNDENKPQ